jgi:hypothetical protein
LIKKKRLEKRKASLHQQKIFGNKIKINKRKKLKDICIGSKELKEEEKLTGDGDSKAR